jgi:hypothetical protein
MAFTASNVLFKTTTAYLTQNDWETQAGLHSQHEIDRQSVLYENEFAINPFSNLVLSNKYGELLIRQRIDEGEYMYYVVVYDNLDCSSCSHSYLGYSHSDFSSSLEYILDRYFNDDTSTDGFDEVYNEQDECYAMIHPECSEFDGEEYDRICGERFADEALSSSQDEEIVYTEEDGCQLYRFTDDSSVISSVNDTNSNYSKKYQIVISACGIPIQTPDGRYISRIKKDNGKHRYYITQVKPELESDDLCYKPSTMFYAFKSQYVGSNLGYTLQEYVYAPQKWM